jgi:hypothetical protein
MHIHMHACMLLFLAVSYTAGVRSDDDVIVYHVSTECTYLLHSSSTLKHGV